MFSKETKTEECQNATVNRGSSVQLPGCRGLWEDLSISHTLTLYPYHLGHTALVSQDPNVTICLHHGKYPHAKEFIQD